VRTVLERTPYDAITLLPWKTYAPGGTHRRATEEPQYHKLLIPGGLAPHIERIETGAHSFTASEDLPASVSQLLHLSHLPIRSEAQLRGKIIRGWESHLRSVNRKPGENYHWERLYARCTDPAPMSMEELARIAAAYASLSDEAAELVYDPISTPL
jgi:hypothetical protein